MACGARTLLVSRHRSGVSHEMKRLSRRGMGLFGHSRRHRSCMSSLAGVFAGYSPVGWWVSFKPGNVGGKGGGGGGFGFNHLISICAGGLLFPSGRIFWQFEFYGISWEGLGRAGGFQIGFVVLILRSRRDRGWDGILFQGNVVV